MTMVILSRDYQYLYDVRKHQFPGVRAFFVIKSAMIIVLGSYLSQLHQAQVYNQAKFQMELQIGNAFMVGRPVYSIVL